MTHTLHRVKTRSGQTDDYVVLIMPARGINNQNSVEVFKKYLDLMAQFDPVNMGAIGCGNFATHTLDEIKANLKPEVPMVHGVFDTRDKLIEVMKALKDWWTMWTAVQKRLVLTVILWIFPLESGGMWINFLRLRFWRSPPCAAMP